MPSAEILLARRTRSSGARWTAPRRAASTASRCSAEFGRARLDGHGRDCVVSSPLSACCRRQLSVGRPSLICVPPARARLTHALPPAVRLPVSPHVPFGAVQRQVFVHLALGRVLRLGGYLYFGRVLGPTGVACQVRRMPIRQPNFGDRDRVQMSDFAAPPFNEPCSSSGFRQTSKRRFNSDEMAVVGCHAYHSACTIDH